jgi:DNA-binding GntR family transcriptional regulator
MMHGMPAVSERTSPLKRAAHASLVDIAYESMIEAIFDRVIEPGGRVGIDASAARLGMSITPVREALARMAPQGLVLQDANRGYTVAPLLSPAQFHALFAARRVLEVESLRVRTQDHTSVERIRDPAVVPDGDIVAIEGLSTRMVEAEHGSSYRHFAEFSRLDRDFHQAVVALGGNSFLVDAWCGLNFHLHVSRLYTGKGVIDYAHALREHERIVVALKRRQPAGLVTAVTAHIERAERRLVALLGQDGR